MANSTSACSTRSIRVRSKLLYQCRSGPLLPEEIFLASPLPYITRQPHPPPQGWLTVPEISDRRNLFFKSKVSGRQILSNPLERKTCRSGCLTLLLPLLSLEQDLCSFWEVLCETLSGSGKIHPFVIWGVGGAWNLELTASS